MPGSLSVGGRLAVLTMMLVACQTEGPVDSGPGPSFATGNATGDPVVTATDPTAAPQDTTLDLRVFGSGYDRGSTVELLLGGQSVGTIRTNSTRYIKSTELVANVTISASAAVATYDVAVTTSRGRKGIGTEMFAVRIKGNADLDSRANWTFYGTMSDGATATRLYGDGRGLDGAASAVSGESAYPGETCGVRGKLFNSTTASNSGDAVFDPDFTPDGSACGRRLLRAEFTAGSPVTLTPFTNARQAWQMSPGETRVQQMGFGNGGPLPCGSKNVSLKYEPGFGSGVSLTRLPDQGAARVWRVESTGNHEAGCYKATGNTAVRVSAHYLPFHAVIVEVPAPAGGW
ncbi:MAG TPA: hypothetical protein VF862_12530 [Gemmatimonadales bacterium]